MDSTLKLALALIAAAALVAGSASQVSGLLELAEESRTARQTKSGGGDVSLKRAANGHFYLDVDVNGTSVKMLADTGASLVVLGEQDAESVGLDPDSLDYTHAVQTANGRAEAAFVVLDELRVGGIVRHNVRALVTRGLPGSLLGMSFFNTLSQVSMEADELVLKD
jgi:aspartyl protease family protein